MSSSTMPMAGHYREPGPTQAGSRQKAERVGDGGAGGGHGVMSDMTCEEVASVVMGKELDGPSWRRSLMKALPYP